LKSEIPDCLTALTEVLIPLNVHTLDLSDNAFGPAGASPLFPFLSQTRTLHTLRLNNNGLGVSGGNMIADALLAQSKRNQAEKLKSSLRVFIAGRNRLENGSMVKLSKAFQEHDQIEHIKMPQNGIRPEGITILMEALQTCPQLKVLDLQDNTFTKAGSMALAKALPTWKQLKVLHVGDCLLSAIGARHVFASLKSGGVNTIEKLHLAFNEIDPQGVMLLCNWLQVHGQSVTLLELNGNCFEPEGKEVDKLKDILSEFEHEDALDELDEMDIESGDEVGEDDEDLVDEDGNQLQKDLGSSDELAGELANLSVSS
jgi:Ran GTPase-activating protein 1